MTEYEPGDLVRFRRPIPILVNRLGQIVRVVSEDRERGTFYDIRVDRCLVCLAEADLRPARIDPDDDINAMTRYQLWDTVRQLRDGIRKAAADGDLTALCACLPETLVPEKETDGAFLDVELLAQLEARIRELEGASG